MTKMQKCLNIHKYISVTNHIKGIKDKNRTIISIDVEITFDNNMLSQ